jgi:hypothetical protein
MAENVHLKITTDAKGASKDVGKLSSGTKAATTETTLLSGAMGKVKLAMAAVGKAAKMMFGTMKAGMISSGIGALVLGVIALFAYFKKTQRGAEMLERALAGMGAVVDVIVDLFSKAGEIMVGAFKNPKQAITDLWEAIKKNLMNRITGFIDGFKALGRVIKGVFSMDWDEVTEGAKEYGTALIQVGTGLDAEQQKAFADGIKAVAKEMNDEADAAMRLKGIMQGIRREEMEFSKVRAQTRQEVAKARLLAMDESLSQEKRLEAINEVMALELKMTSDLIALQKKKVAAKAAELALGESMIEDEEELMALEVELINMTTQSTMTQKRLMTEVEALNLEIIAKKKTEAKRVSDEAKKVAKAEADALKVKETAAKASAAMLAGLDKENTLAVIDNAIERAYTLADIDEKAALAKVAGMENSEALSAAIRKKYGNVRGAIAKAEAAAEIALQKQQLAAVGDMLAQAANMAGKGTESWKALKIAEAIMGTATGAQQAFNAVAGIPYIGPILAPIAAGMAVAAGMKQIETIRNTEIPIPPEGGKARGGWIKGYGSGTSDSIPARLSRGEVVINAQSARAFRPLLSNINVAGGGIGFARGGATSSAMQMGRKATALMDTQSVKAYVLTDEMTNSQSRLNKIRRRASV